MIITIYHEFFLSRNINKSLFNQLKKKANVNTQTTDLQNIEQLNLLLLTNIYYFCCISILS